MNILITGATGFVGSHLCEQLQKEGHNIYALVRNTQKAKEFNVPGVYIRGSLSPTTENSWIKNLPDNLDAVIHTAGIVHSMNIGDFYSVNALATQRLILDLKQKYSSLKFTLISSLAASGPSNKGESKSESDNPSPVSDYGKSKKIAERFAKNITPKEWSVSIIRPPMVIGPRDPAILDIFKMINNSFVVTAGLNGGSNEYSFVCVYDLVETIVRTLDKNYPHPEFYFSAYPEIITMSELYLEIKNQMQKKFLFNIRIPAPLIKVIAFMIGLLSKLMKLDVRLTPDKVHELLPKAWTCSSEKSTEQLSQNYKWNLEKTIAVTLADYKKRDWL